MVPILQELTAHWMRWALKKNHGDLCAYQQYSVLWWENYNTMRLYSLVRDHKLGCL